MKAKNDINWDLYLNILMLEHENFILDENLKKRLVEKAIEENLSETQREAFRRLTLSDATLIFGYVVTVLSAILVTLALGMIDAGTLKSLADKPINLFLHVLAFYLQFPFVNILFFGTGLISMSLILKFTIFRPRTPKDYPLLMLPLIQRRQLQRKIILEEQGKYERSFDEWLHRKKFRH